MSMTQEELLNMRIAELEVALLNMHPQMPGYLKLIHAELLKYPELVHIMNNEQRAVLTAALSKQSGISVFQSLSSKKPTAKSLATATPEQLGI